MKNAVKVLKAQKEEILNTWIAKITRDVAATKDTSRLVLRDHIPHLLDDIIRVMDRFDHFDVVQEEMIYKEIFESSVEHGRHRATSSGYSLGQILREYIIFDKVITTTLMNNNAFSKEAGMVIKYSVENAMLYSGIAFTNSLQDIRQKLIAMVAHDMRNPISAALFAVKMMKYEQGEERFEKVQNMAINSLNRSVELIENLLDSVSIEAGGGMAFNFAKLNILEVIQSVYNEATESYSNSVKLDCHEKEIDGVYDGTMVRRVLENFISNGVKYGGSDTPITISCSVNEEFVEISVHNNGNPIEPERQEEIFNFLNTSHGKGHNEIESRGIGLSLVKAVAEAHAGRMELKSDESSGTTFTIILKKFSNEPGKVRAASKIV